MKQMITYTDQRGRVYYVTSHKAFQIFSGKEEGITSALWSGTRFVKTDELCRVGRGVYRRETNVAKADAYTDGMDDLEQQHGEELLRQAENMKY